MDPCLDPDAWSEDIAALVCDRSAVIRLGARLVLDEDELAVPSAATGPGPDYLEQPEPTDPTTKEEPRLESSEKPSGRVGHRRLRPRDHELAWKVIVPDQLARGIAEFPELADTVKGNIAAKLARRIDQAFLHGDGTVGPLGITNTNGTIAHAGAGDALARAADMLTRLRHDGVHFANAGWVLGPETVDVLTRLGEDRRTLLDPARHLSVDGRDGGVLLGYPLIVSPAARDVAADTWMIHFSADWGQAWIGADRQLVTVDISTEAHFQRDETVVRAVMHHDFAVRHPQSFIYTAAADDE